MSEEQLLDSFQEQVQELLLRHRSILDILTKSEESNARIHRAIIKSVTECGCIEIHGTRQNSTATDNIKHWVEQYNTHVFGSLCENCKDHIQDEIGKHIFYLVALCNLFQIPLGETIQQEQNHLQTLGSFHLR